MQLELRDHVTSVYPAFARYAGAIRSIIYPRGRDSMSAAGIIFPRGKQAKLVFAAHTSGALILPQNARGLAIPLHNFRSGRRRLSPSEFGEPLTYIPLRRSPNVLGVLATPARTKRIRGGGRVLPAAARRARETVARRGLSEALGERWVPQFLIVRRARLAAAFEPRPILQKWGRQMLDLVAYAVRGARRG